MTTRRQFLKQALSGGAVLALGGMMPGLSAKSYANVPGANDRLRAGAVGVNSRGLALATNFSKQENCVVNHICDVDSRALEKCATEVENFGKGKVKRSRDIRKMLEDKDMRP